MPDLSVGMFVFYLILALAAGLVGGYFLTRYLFQKQMKENPPINEKMIRTMYAQMGQKPSEAKIRQIMNEVNKNK